MLTDPPYNVDLSRHIPNGVKPTLIGIGDDFSFLSNYKNRFVWGFPYINDRECGGWLVWRKHGVENPNVQMLSPVEMAYTNLWKGFKLFEQLWCGYLRNEQRYDHPCQKPLKITSWIISQYKIPKCLILDPFMGSGTTLVAAKQLNRKAIGIEIEEKYCEIAVKRLQQSVFEF